MNPATSQLFTITSEAKDLDDEKKEHYQSITSKILWIVKHSRTDLETVVYFMCTRVQRPTEENWGGIRRVPTYLKVTKDGKRIMGSDNFLKI